MNLSSLQARVRSLRRKLALPYAQLMVQRMADNLCSEWSRAQVENQPTPSPQAFVRQGRIPPPNLHRRRPLPRTVRPSAAGASAGGVLVAVVTSGKGVLVGEAGLVAAPFEPPQPTVRTNTPTARISVINSRDRMTDPNISFTPGACLTINAKWI